MLKGIGLLFAAAVFIYLLFYPFLRHSVNRKKLLKWFMIGYLLILIVSTATTYCAGTKQPGSPERRAETPKQHPGI